MPMWNKIKEESRECLESGLSNPKKEQVESEIISQYYSIVIQIYEKERTLAVKAYNFQ